MTVEIQQAAHTPGPWRVEGSAIECRLSDGHGRTLARIPTGWPHGGRWNESVSNARLMAAAPDLLAALEAIAEFWNATGGQPMPLSPWALITDEDTNDQPIRDVVNDAIAKARGLS